MATRSKLNWKVLDSLLPLLEKEGWSLDMIAQDWGISLATLEAHLTQEVSMATRKPYPERQYVNWQELDPLIDRSLAEGRNVAAIAKDSVSNRIPFVRISATASRWVHHQHTQAQQNTMVLHKNTVTCQTWYTIVHQKNTIIHPRYTQAHHMRLKF